MDKTVPAGAAILLDFIYRTETDKGPPDCYNVIFANRQSAVKKPVTQMTLAEVQDAQKTWATKAWAQRFNSSKASSATGAPQLMRATLAGLIDELGLRMTQVLDGNLQDRLGYHLLKRRGYAEYMAGRITRTEFGKRLAQEWASFPVLADTQGAHRKVARGQSYYAGDGLNKALVAPAAVESVLDRAKAAGNAVPTVAAAPQPVVLEPANDNAPGFWARLFAAFRRAV